MRSDFHFSIYSSPLMMAMEHLYPDNLDATCSHRCVQPAQRSITMIDDVGMWAESAPPIPAPHRHPRLGPDAYQRQRSAVTVDMTEGSQRAAECTGWSYGDAA